MPLLLKLKAQRYKRDGCLIEPLHVNLYPQNLWITRHHGSKLSNPRYKRFVRSPAALS